MRKALRVAACATQPCYCSISGGLGSAADRGDPRGDRPGPHPFRGRTAGVGRGRRDRLGPPFL